MESTLPWPGAAFCRPATSPSTCCRGLPFSSILSMSTPCALASMFSSFSALLCRAQGSHCTLHGVKSGQWRQENSTHEGGLDSNLDFLVVWEALGGPLDQLVHPQIFVHHPGVARIDSQRLQQRNCHRHQLLV